MEINHISKIFACHMRKTADERGVPAGYRSILFHLSLNPGGLSPLELAKKTHVTAPTVSVTLQKMERDGYTYRVASDTDQRSFKVYLTEKGKQIEDGNKTVAQDFDEKAIHNMTQEEIDTLLSLLGKIRSNLTDSN